MSGKARRQRLIGDWLRDQEVGSQEDLVVRLAVAGITATQATVSRDLDELGAVKSRREGTIRYVLPEGAATGQPAALLDRLLAEWVIDIVEANGLIVLRTPPGSANLVASALDRGGLDGVAGTIAGDDTIFIALAEGASAPILAGQLRRRRGDG